MEELSKVNISSPIISLENSSTLNYKEDYQDRENASESLIKDTKESIRLLVSNMDKSLKQVLYTNKEYVKYISEYMSQSSSDKLRDKSDKNSSEYISQRLDSSELTLESSKNLKEIQKQAEKNTDKILSLVEVQSAYNETSNMMEHSNKEISNTRDSEAKLSSLIDNSNNIVKELSSNTASKESQSQYIKPQLDSHLDISEESQSILVQTLKTLIDIETYSREADRDRFIQQDLLTDIKTELESQNSTKSYTSSLIDLRKDSNNRSTKSKFVSESRALDKSKTRLSENTRDYHRSTDTPLRDTNHRNTGFETNHNKEIEGNAFRKRGLNNVINSESVSSNTLHNMGINSYSHRGRSSSSDITSFNHSNIFNTSRENYHSGLNNTRSDFITKDRVHPFSHKKRSKASSLLSLGTDLLSGGLLPDTSDLISGASKSGSSLISKMAGSGASILSKGAKFLGPLGLLTSTAISGVSGWNDANTNFDIEDGQEATLGQKLSSSAGGILSDLSFGLLDSKTSSNFIHDTGSKLMDYAPISMLSSVGDSISSWWGGDDTEENNIEATSSVAPLNSISSLESLENMVENSDKVAQNSSKESLGYTLNNRDETNLIDTYSAVKESVPQYTENNSWLSTVNDKLQSLGDTMSNAIYNTSTSVVSPQTVTTNQSPQPSKTNVDDVSLSMAISNFFE
ncbi:hypothetical protein ThvES_00008160 [Thiovulum sp. ES]|nr:hypothetical protein ThvES_00008160 [Thiovulum sp. ES]